MTTPNRVQRHRQAEAARRKVRATGTGRIGTRTTIPRQKPPTAKRPPYRKTAAGAGFSAMLGALFFATGSIFWAVGAVTTASATAVVARIEYRRELAQVKATGKPIADPAPAARRTDDLSDRREPKPTELDTHTPRGPLEAQQRRARQKASVGDHASRCQAKPPGGPTCRCPDGPNRKGKAKTPAKRATGARRKTT